MRETYIHLELRQQIPTYDHVLGWILLQVIYVKFSRRGFCRIQFWKYKFYIGGMCFQKVTKMGAPFDRMGIFVT